MDNMADFGVEMSKMLPLLLREVSKRHKTLFAQKTLDVSHILVLDALREKGPLTMTELSGALHMSMGAVTGIIDRMIDKDLVKRERSQEDRRVVKVGLVENGKKTAEMVNKARVDFTNEMYAVLTPEERKEYLRLIKKVYAKFLER